MSRSKSGLLPKKPATISHGCQPDEVAARRLAATKARQELYDLAYGQDTADDVPIFADFVCGSLGAIGRLYIEMEENMRPGVRYMVRVQAVR